MQTGKTATTEEQTAEALEELEGTLERVIFHNAENGYTVFRFQPKGKGGDAVSVVGHMVDPQPGVGLLLRGGWVNNPKFGRQFRMETFESVLPATVEGIRHYLGSGLIKGVGETMAARIVARFGESTFSVLDDAPDRLIEVEGVGAKTLERIKTSWAEHRGIRDLIMFLQPHGVSTAYAVRIYRYYGTHALTVVRENPYRLAMDIHGIGFITADGVATKLGFSKDSPLRAEAGVLYMLGRLTEDGHVYFPFDGLVTHTGDKLDIRYDLVEDAIHSLEREERVVLEDLGEGVGVFLTRFHHYETKIAYYLRRVLASPKAVHFENPDAVVDKVLGKLDIALAPEQLEAVRTSTRSKVMVLTGGAGYGQDHHHQRHHPRLRRGGGTHPACRAHRTRRQAHVRDKRARVAHHPPPAGVQPQRGWLRP